MSVGDWIAIIALVLTGTMNIMNGIWSRQIDKSYQLWKESTERSNEQTKEFIALVKALTERKNP